MTTPRTCREPVGEVPLPCAVCDALGTSGVAFRSARWRVCVGCSDRGYRAGERVERERFVQPATMTREDYSAMGKAGCKARDDGDLITVRHYVVTPEGAALEVARA